MQRAAQRDDRRDPRERRGGRLRRALVCAAAVPAVLVAAGCSSDSGSDGSSGADATRTAGDGSGGPSVSASPTVRAAAYRTLPGACGVLSKKTLGELVPKGVKSGKTGTSDESGSRASCSWSSLDNHGVKGSQFRWLNVSLLRFESDANRGTGETQAQTYYAKQVEDARTVSGAKNTKSEPVAGTGDQATAVRYDLKKKEGNFKQQTVVARVENVVVTLDYNGAGLAGEKAPNADDLTKAAEKAVKEVVAAVSSANGEGAGTAPSPSASASASPSKSATKDGSKDGAKSDAKSASPSQSASASPSESAAQKS